MSLLLANQWSLFLIIWEWGLGRIVLSCSNIFYSLFPNRQSLHLCSTVLRLMLIQKTVWKNKWTERKFELFNPTWLLRFWSCFDLCYTQCNKVWGLKVDRHVSCMMQGHPSCYRCITAKCVSLPSSHQLKELESAIHLNIIMMTKYEDWSFTKLLKTQDKTEVKIWEIK